MLATTTSVANSGLLDAVLPEYRHGDVQPILVGSGRALDMLANRNADVVISHAPLREAEALRAHSDWHYRKILFNDFLIVGPAEDPAGVRQSADALDAVRRIARSGVTFLSRGDESGTHERERELWEAAGARPDAAALVIAGAGMGQTLRVASSTGAYTLTDRGTFETLRASIHLVELHAGDPRLLNTYAVIARASDTAAMTFADWLAEGEGRRRIEQALATGSVRGFTVWPGNAPADRPEALPK